MEINVAQHEVRSVYWGGSVGQAVSGAIWLASAALGTWVGVRYAIIMLVIGGIFIFPLTQLVFKLLGQRTSVSSGNPFNRLAMQIAFIVPLNIPVIGAAALYNLNWFYPAFMLVVGTHYMPFISLYGMWQFGILAAALIGGGVAISLLLPHSFVIGGWVTGVLLVAFALAARRMAGSIKS